jgi:hypothetical protein
MKTFEEILKRNGCRANVLTNMLSPDAIKGNHYDRLLKSVKEFAEQEREKAFKEAWNTRRDYNWKASYKENYEHYKTNNPLS